MKILVTGSAGFIGSHLCERLISEKFEVVGIDNINNYYDIQLKKDRLKKVGIDLKKNHNKKVYVSDIYKNYKFFQINLEDNDLIKNIFNVEKFDAVCNLAAQAGVRYSMTNPMAYINSNVVGFMNILEACRRYKVKNLCYASSSSVYGLNKNLPFSTNDNVDHPISLYAASKKSNELMAHTYSHLYNISTTGLRFFTVYGPWGRPDMALFLFVKAALENKKIDIYNNGNMIRDFTYIDDIVEGIFRVIKNPAKSNKKWGREINDISSSTAPYKIYNIGNNSPINLMDFIYEIENKLNIKIKKNLMPIQAGDVPATYANVDDLINDFNYKPKTKVKTGISRFIDWFLEYYKIK